MEPLKIVFCIFAANLKFSFQLQDLGCILNWFIKENGKMKEITFSCWKNFVSSIKKLLLLSGFFVKQTIFVQFCTEIIFSGRFNFICFFAEQLGWMNWSDKLQFIALKKLFWPNFPCSFFLRSVLEVKSTELRQILMIFSSEKLTFFKRLYH